MPANTARYKQNRVQQLRGFCYAVRLGGVSRAAARLGLSQPTVSLQIQALERELDVTLFERRGPRMHPTSDGEILFELAQPLIERLDALEDEFAARRHDVESGTIHVAAGGSTLQYVLPRYVERFIHLHPGIEVRLNNVTGEAGLALLRAGEVDLAVGPLPDVPDDIKFYPIVSYEPMLITPVDHPLAKKKRITLKDISKHPLILPPRRLSTWRQVEYVFTQHNLSYRVNLEVGGYEVIKKYVELGMGISIVMSNCLTEKDRLFRVSVGRYFPERTYGVVLRRHAVHSPQVRRFVEVLDPEIDLDRATRAAPQRGQRGRRRTPRKPQPR